ncbi:hypothetical protein [Sphingopyxis sp. JAI128]|uniref:hypothetical protein n=1 Tax=Sphingopyxis sp. JAI128 TaxID=2723066 RepID=UPI00161BC486|nr:hypothetical protein [Sphingopyxis sp. JAI128]MBB6427729.1 hypothetical protein [Sphingopyxis sp. JAI128]
MDLNQLLYHHQMALMTVSHARRDGDLLPNFDLPRYYAKRIHEYRERRGLADDLSGVAEEGEGLSAVPPVSEPAADYPFFLGDTLIAELLVNEALAMTEEERASFGLEHVVGRLAAVQEEIWVIGRDIYRALGFDEDKLAKLAAKLPALPDLHRPDAVHLQPFRSLSEAGIVHIYAEQFRVGPFRYSSIDDARAALGRESSANGAKGGQANDS